MTLKEWVEHWVQDFLIWQGFSSSFILLSENFLLLNYRKCGRRNVKDSCWHSDLSDASGIEVWSSKQGLLSGDSGQHNRNLSARLPLNPETPRPSATESCFTSTRSSGEGLATPTPHPVRRWGQRQMTNLKDRMPRESLRRTEVKTRSAQMIYLIYIL